MSSSGFDARTLEQLATAVVCLSQTKHITYVNAAAEQLMSSSANHVIGKPIDQVIDLPEAFLTNIENALELGQPYRDRQLHLSAAGHELGTVDCSITPHRNDKQEGTVILEMSAVDRSLRIARDAALLAQQEHVRSLLRGLAHEIKNPLGGIRGAAQLLEKQLEGKELREYTGIVIQESDRLQTLIDRMLGPASRPELKTLNIHEVLEHVRRVVRVGSVDTVFHVMDYDPSIPEFISDKDRLIQVFLNIASNALQAVGEQGTITYKTRVMRQFTLKGDRHPLVAAIEIQDDGPGIPKDLADQVFYPMVSGKRNGTGLGLSIAQSIMQQLGGLIECRSQPGNTVFTVIIPLEDS
ncbi:MAG: PAS domain-containing protein [Gammaproteobacteria bacterium]|nr:PAS domain-containing protein [Gammaproteobacteria bacterium]